MRHEQKSDSKPAEGNQIARITRRFDASCEQIFDAWLDPERAHKWLFAAGGKSIWIEIDPRVGGSFLFLNRRDEVDVEQIGQFAIIDRPHRIVFTLAIPQYSHHATRVTIEIAAVKKGCELTLSHGGLRADWVSSTEANWAASLDALGRAENSSKKSSANVSTPRMYNPIDLLQPVLKPASEVTVNPIAPVFRRRVQARPHGLAGRLASAFGSLR